MARKTIIVGLNQTTMAALSMAIIASYVDGPGLGKPVLPALVRNDVGGAIVPGLLIVAIAIMLDRATTAASERAELAARGVGLIGRPRQVVLGVGAVRGPGRGLVLAPERRRRRLPQVRASAADRRLARLASSTWVVEPARRAGRGVQGLHHLGAAQPDADPARRVPVVARGPRHRRHRPAIVGGLKALVPTLHLPRRNRVPRPVARRDDHPEHDPRRHPAGDGAGRRLRRLDGPQPPGRPDRCGPCSTRARRSPRSST